MNTDNILTIKFHNRSIPLIFKLTQLAERDLLSVNLPWYALVKRRQQMAV